MEANNTTETLPEVKEVLSEEAQQEIVKNELALIPEQERKEIVNVVKTADIVLIDSHKKKIKSFKARFPAKKYAITEDLVYNDEVYEKALEQWREVKNYRTKNAEPEFKKLKAPYVALTKFYNDTTNPIIADYKAIEKPISDFVDKLEALKKEEAEKEKIALAQKVNDRVDQLINAGAVFNDGYYESGSLQFDVPIISLGMVDIQSATDQIFENILNQIAEKNALVAERKTAYELEQKRIAYEAAEKARLEKEKFDQEQAELKAAKDKFEKEQAEFKRQQEEFKLQKEAAEKKQREAEAEQKRLQAEAAEKLWRGRLTQLADIGWNGQYAFDRNDDSEAVFTYEELLTFTDEQFATVRDSYNKIIDNRKEQQRLKDLEEIKTRQEIADKLEKEKQQQIAAKALEDKRIADEKAEKERLEKLAAADDATKYADVKQQLKNISIPEMQSKEYKAKIVAITTFIASL